MSKCFIEGMGGAAAKGLPAIYAQYPEGSVCTCTNGDETYKAKTTYGFWLFAGLSIGTWTLTITDPTGENQGQSETVEITSEGQIVSVELSYMLWLYKEGDEYTDITGGWTSSGYTMASGSLVAGVNDGDSLNLYGTNGVTTLLGTANVISFADRTKLRIKANVISTSESYSALTAQVRATKTGVSGATATAKVDSSGIGEQVLELDVSSINKGYIVVLCGGRPEYKSKALEIALI